METELKTRRINTHAHYITPEYRAALVAAGHAQPDGMPGIPPWSPEATLAMMDKLGIGMAMLSISSPGVHFGNDQAARQLARLVNEQGCSFTPLRLRARAAASWRWATPARCWNLCSKPPARLSTCC